jgi:hypothetical protein
VYLYLVASFANHSCDPNAKYDHDFDTQEFDTGNGAPVGFFFMDVTLKSAATTFRATRAIAAGEEITISYVGEGVSYAARQEQLLLNYGISCCTCAKCEKERK